ncbi:MAG: 16S rRNA (cytosine(967)-C(5))-methyltransferase RsmB [Candidatus Aureabacteria bacterium]|nr:16S rRNA (cytosine(967)-C(5))-methyltransferase RsmB [Candidatus Auribacterota bacterium]
MRRQGAGEASPGLPGRRGKAGGASKQRVSVPPPRAGRNSSSGSGAGAGRKISGREVALAILRKVLKGNRFIDELLETELGRHAPPPAERGLATELAYGCVRRRGTLDWVVASCAGRPLERISEGLRDILRIGVYQLLYCDRIPAYAAVHEAVEQAKRHGPPGSSLFVNAVLRQASRTLSALAFPPREADPARHCAVLHSHPQWLVERWIGRWGYDAAEALCIADNRTPTLTVRVNTLKTDRDSLIAALAREGVDAAPIEADEAAVRLGGLSRPLGEIGAFREGLFQVQDLSGIRIARFLSARKGERIADLCAAPGGKATAIAELTGDAVEICCVDRTPEKVAMIETNARRLGVRSIRTVVGDAREPDACGGGARFDRVLLDAPCSNTGVLGRRPEVRWRLTPDDIARLALLQRSLLDAAWGSVRAGGVLVYSTCSVEPEENEELVRGFVSAHHAATLEEELHMLPHRDGCDGAYAARLVRKG